MHLPCPVTDPHCPTTPTPGLVGPGWACAPPFGSVLLSLCARAGAPASLRETGASFCSLNEGGLKGRSSQQRRLGTPSQGSEGPEPSLSVPGGVRLGPLACPQGEGSLGARAGMDGVQWSVPWARLFRIPSRPLPEAVAGEAEAPAPVPEPWVLPSSSLKEPASPLVSTSSSDLSVGPSLGEGAWALELCADPTTPHCPHCSQSPWPGPPHWDRSSPRRR